MKESRNVDLLNKNYHTTFGKVKLPDERKDPVDIENRIKQCVKVVYNETKHISSLSKDEKYGGMKSKPLFYAFLKLGYKKVVQDHRFSSASKKEGPSLTDIPSIQRSLERCRYKVIIPSKIVSKNVSVSNFNSENENMKSMKNTINTKNTKNSIKSIKAQNSIFSREERNTTMFNKTAQNFKINTNSRNSKISSNLFPTDSSGKDIPSKNLTRNPTKIIIKSNLNLVQNLTDEEINPAYETLLAEATTNSKFPIRKERNNTSFLSQIIPRRKSSGIEDDIYDSLITKQIRPERKSLFSRQSSLNLDTLEANVLNNRTHQINQIKSTIFSTEISPFYTQEKFHTLKSKVPFLNNKVEEIMKSHKDISDDIKSNMTFSKIKLPNTKNDLKGVLNSKMEDRLLDIVKNEASGVTNYIDKPKADLIRYSDTLVKMNNSILYNMGDSFLKNYSQYAKAANVYEEKRHYSLSNTDRILSNSMKIKSKVKSIINTQKRALKSQKFS